MSTNFTSANAEALITWKGLLNGGQKRLENFSAERSWEFEPLQLTEHLDSMDGYFNVAYVYNSVPFLMTFAPNSNSIRYFTYWARMMRLNKFPYKCNLQIRIKDTCLIQMTDGILESMPPYASANKALEPVPVGMRFGDVRTIYEDGANV